MSKAAKIMAGALALCTAGWAMPAAAIGDFSMPTPPQSLALDLSRMAGLHSQIAGCAAREPSSRAWQELVQISQAKAHAARTRAEGLFGAIELVGVAQSDAAKRCNRWARGDFQQNLAELSSSIDAGLDAIAIQTRAGAWMGLFPLCRDSVASARGTQAATAGWSLSVSLTPAAAEAMSRYSQRFVRAHEPPAMSFRVNNLELAAPRVFEPIAGEMVLAWSGDRSGYEAALTALNAKCPAKDLRL